MNKINGVEQNEFVFNAVLQIIEGVIMLAGEYDGRVYGSYVRNVIVPRLKDPNCICEYDRIGIMFPDFVKKDGFIKEMQLKYDGFVKKHDQFMLTEGIFIADINLFTNRVHSAYDVNELEYYYDHKQLYFHDLLHHLIYPLTTCQLDMTKFYESPIVNNILHKTVNVMPTLLQVFETKDLKMQQYYVDELNTLFINKGWIVQFKDLVFNKTIMLEDLTENVLNEFKKVQTKLEKYTKQRDLLLIDCLEKYKDELNLDKRLSDLYPDLFKDVLINQLLTK